MNLRSDNEAPAAEQILQALHAANQGAAAAYGADRWTGQLEQRFSDLFETRAWVFVLPTGTAANALALAHLGPNYGAVAGFEHAHIMVDECGAPEFFSGGAKMIGLPGEAGRLRPGDLRERLEAMSGDVHEPLASVLSLTQATECGTCYRPAQIEQLAEVAREHGMRVHMDGARFANAVASMGLSPARLAPASGVDVLSFGATKSGTLGAEALIFFDSDLATGFGHRRMKGGHLMSKMRYASAQLLAYLDNDLWLELAGHANAMAAELATAVADCSQASLLYPVEANELFVVLDPALDRRLKAADIDYHPWPGETDTYRWVTSHATDPAEVALLSKLLLETSAARPMP